MLIMGCSASHSTNKRAEDKESRCPELCRSGTWGWGVVADALEESHRDIQGTFSVCSAPQEIT